MDFSKLLDWIKLSPKYLLPIFLVSGFLLFSGNSILTSFGLDSFVIQFRPWIGIVFLLSASLLCSEAIIRIVRYFSNRYNSTEKFNQRVKRLYKLTPDEKNILLYYLENNTRTQYMDISDGLVKELEAFEIIYRSSNVGDINSWAYNIQPWVWDYLKKNKDKIFSKDDIEKYKPYFQ